MKLAIVQMEVLAGDLQANATKIRKIYQTLAQSYDLIVFPEMALPGYFIGDRWEQSSFLRDCEFLTNELAAQTSDAVLIFGSIGIDWIRKNEDGRVRKYSAAFCAQDGKLIRHPILPYTFWPKILSPNYREFDDSRHFFDLRKFAAETGKDLRTLLAPLRIKRGKVNTQVALCICEDAWDQDYGLSPITELCTNPVDLILNISCSPYTFAKVHRRDEILSQHAKRTGIPLAYVNCVGSQNLGKTVFGFDGSSAVYRPGQDTLRTKDFEENVLSLDLTSQEAKVFAISNHRSGLSLNASSFAQPYASEIAETYAALTGTLKCILRQWRISKVIVGASGGIDSALAAALYAKVLGPQSVFLVNMPTRFNSDLTKNAAEKLASALQTPYAVVPIQDLFDRTVAQLNAIQFTQNEAQLSLQGLHLENIQARDRSARVLAAIAAMRGAVFSCNANKTELTVGYSTLYGDAGGFLAALGDLWKGQVYAMARYFNQTIAGETIIPEDSIRVVPSAELSADHDVNAGKGDPLVYPYHDALFKTWVEHWDRKTPEDILLAFQENQLEPLLGFSRKDVLQFFRNDIQAFISDLERWWVQYVGMGAVKRVQSPPVLALSRRAFGNDHRECLGSAQFSRRYYELRSKLLSLDFKKL